MTGPTILFAGGGTGGHLFPGIAVAEEVRRRHPDARIVFSGSEREVERRILESHGYAHRPLPVEPSTTLRSNPLKFLYRYWLSTLDARRLLDEIAPRVVVGLGGFASVPIVRTAASSRHPVVLLEQNTVPGRATRWLASRASVVCTSFDQTEAILPKGVTVEVTGNPVRRHIAECPANAERRDHGEPTLLVLGGSQGATAVNDAVLATLPMVPPLAGWRVVHQTGHRDLDRIRSAYTSLGVNAVVEPFFDDLLPHYRTATCCITRAGATSLAELACVGTPFITIPYPGSIHDHQLRNAEFYRDHADQPVVAQSSSADVTAGTLARELERLVDGPTEERESRRDRLRRLARPDAAARVADVIERVRWP